MPRDREREKKNWRDVDRSKDRSFHATDDKMTPLEAKGRQSAVVKEYRAALEALFQKKPEAVEKIEKMMPTVVLPRATEDDQVTGRRQDMLRKVSLAQGPKAISDAIDGFLAAGHSLPDDQEVFLQMLEHRDEQRVREALARLDHLLMGQLPKRKPVLVQRLRRLEEHAEEETTRQAAATLRRKVA